MKSLSLALLISLFAVAFTVVKDTTYTVNQQQSKLTWIGRKVGGEHTGTIQLSNGKINWNGKSLTGGTFEVDMSSITNTDVTDKEYNQKLVSHLKSDDFFSTDKYPKARFVITKVTPLANSQSQIKGKLTIKGITKEVEFPATIQASGSQLTARAKVVVDRTLYNIRYGSGSFFDNLGDKAINNEFELNVVLVANKAEVIN
ncbi:YceI family protein [Cesiribacter sp. SM1]|uniref:YceI family protein n=1 Tax=Cesiribacter sp. SM1 TaxID=2861196 RepID=UPI001CD76205|nr:YceI family protein [Cesiribacter sp. SM1]